MQTAIDTAHAPPPTGATPDLGALKARQRTMWGTGDYAVIGATLPIVAECLCEAVDLRAGERVLDVATGSGNVAALVATACRRTCRDDSRLVVRLVCRVVARASFPSFFNRKVSLLLDH